LFVTQPLLITNARIVGTPFLTGWLLTEGRTIKAIGYGEVPAFENVETIDAGSLTLLSGFIDVHVHGADGHETMDASPDALRSMARFYARHGVTSFLATTWTEPRQRIMAALETIAEIQGPQPDGATILGAHLEGPYINADRRGAQRAEDVRRAERDEALAFLDLGVIRLTTVAPEFAENEWFIRECVQRGVTVSAGHTAATYAQVQEAVWLGVTQATHTYNAMTGLSHREPGTLGGVLTSPEIRCELIADNIHVHPAAMHILFACKGVDGTILITDAVRPAGLPDGDYEIDARTVQVKEGAVRLPDGTLAGSTLTMDRALRNFMRATSQPLDVLWPTSSLNAARAIGVADHKGSLERGKDADFVLVDDDLNVHLTVVEGRVVYRR
jgi:N-acetylglucosamine-6-phosphate deacetylase